MNAELPFRFFDPKEQVFMVERAQLPHWAQHGTMCFITWRTWDSMPKAVMNRWLNERNRWLEEHGIDARHEDWRVQLERLPMHLQLEFHNTFSARFEAMLDECHGDCVLRRPELAAVVGSSLQHFDGKRYVVSDFVVMPNHVHLLAAFSSADDMLSQCRSWKHYTAVKINRELNRCGRFWEVDSFDHLIRSEEQYNYYRNYIAENPTRARLSTGQYLHYSSDR